MSRCDTCGQVLPLTGDDYLAQRMDYYRSAHGMLRDLSPAPGKEPTPYEVLLAARFLAGDDKHEAVDTVDEDDDG